MAALMGLIAGALVGAWTFGDHGAAIGGIIGFVVGALVASQRERAAHLRPQSVESTRAAASSGAADATLAQRVLALERRVVELERMLRAGASATTMPASDVAPAAPQAPSEVAVTAPPATAHASEPVRREATAGAPDVTLTAEAFEPRPAAAGGAAHSFPPGERTAAPPNAIWAWIVGGNTLARIGVVLLFIGVGFLLKYAVEHVYVPVSVRLSLVALGGVALLLIGWRLRETRRPYAMVLQGGGVGILYLTVFAALRLYALVSPLAAFALLFWISALSSFLAVRQDAVSLAALGAAGGFLAPILTSTQAGDHVLLFGYYALLNVGILGIAWFKAWRPLNLLGFVFTFLVGTFWGVTRYRPQDFATTEPFLVLFFLFYVAIAILYALRRSVEVRHYVDAGLVFGTPLVAAGLQSALVRDIEYAMAWSALAMGGLYLIAARILWQRRREDIRLLIESFIALGVVFATLAIPLGLDARWTAAAWAVEGAAILWAGVRQKRLVVRAFGLLLQFGAGIAFLLGLSLWAPPAAPAAIPIANSAYVGAVLVAFAGLFSACALQRPGSGLRDGERHLGAVAFAWGVLWWLFAGGREIERFAAVDLRLPAFVTFLAASAVAFAVAEKRLRWPAARVPALLLLPALLVIALFEIVRHWEIGGHLFTHGGAVAWPVAIAAAIGLLRAFERNTAFDPPMLARALEPSHAVLLWLVLLLAAHEAAWAGGQIAYRHGVWSIVPWGLVPALGVAGIVALSPGRSWPVGVHRRGYLVVGASPVVALLALWSIVASIRGDGDPWPLPYFPLVNPLDLTQAAVLLACGHWALRVRRDDREALAAAPATTVAGVFAALAFLWINALALRTVHFWFDVPYTLHALWRSTIVQAVLSLLWSTLALATMVFANRRQFRGAWLAGATLLGVVVVKLFAVELAQVGTVTRIVSFIGVGLLLLLIGYLAPVPPRRAEDSR